jgi:DNA-binding transcriptional LysR family regulator
MPTVSAKTRARRATAASPPTVLDWGDLQHFVALCSEGSASAAAQALQVHHATVLRRIAALETTLGVPLLVLRGTRYEREIRLTTTDTLVRSLLAPLIEAFCERHPEVQVRIVVNNNFLSLTRREADVAIRGSNRPPSNLVGRRVGDIQTAPYASRAYLRSLGLGTRRTPLTQLDWVGPDDSLAHLEQAKWLVRSIPAERVVMTVDSLVGMLQAVQQGIGAAMLLCPLADGDRSLVRLAPPDSALDTQIWILTHPGLRQVARVRAFSQFMFEALSRNPRLVHGGAACRSSSGATCSTSSPWPRVARWAAPRSGWR